MAHMLTFFTFHYKFKKKKRRKNKEKPFLQTKFSLSALLFFSAKRVIGGNLWMFFGFPWFDEN